MSMNAEIKKIVRQNEVIISLLGRVAFTEDRIRETVISRKQKPEKYIEGYNACDGDHTLSDIAKIIGVTPSTLSPILKEWEEFGIIYEVQRPKGKFYHKLFPL